MRNLYKKTLWAVSILSSETRTRGRRVVLTPEEVNARRPGQHNLRAHATQIRSQIDMMQQMMYQGILNRRAGNDH